MTSNIRYMRNPLTDTARKFVDLHIDEGVFAATSYYSALKLPEQLKPQFIKELQKEFSNRGININVKI